MHNYRQKFLRLFVRSRVCALKFIIIGNYGSFNKSLIANNYPPILHTPAHWYDAARLTPHSSRPRRRRHLYSKQPSAPTNINGQHGKENELQSLNSFSSLPLPATIILTFIKCQISWKIPSKVSFPICHDFASSKCALSPRQPKRESSSVLHSGADCKHCRSSALVTSQEGWQGSTVSVGSPETVVESSESDTCLQPLNFPLGLGDNGRGSTKLWSSWTPADLDATMQWESFLAGVS